MGRPAKWTEETLRIEVLNYKTKTELCSKNSGAYAALKRLKLLNKICGHMIDGQKIKWSLNNVHKEALKYKTKGEFRKNSPRAYDACCAHKYNTLCCSHMPEYDYKWDLITLKEEALKYKTRNEFKHGSAGAYVHCGTLGVIDEVCKHMIDGLKCDNDVIYMWEVLNFKQNDKKIYKVGVTSQRLGDLRIKQVALASGFGYNIKIMEYTSVKATTIESAILKLSPSLGFSGFDGCTEFRLFSDKEVDSAMKIIKKGILN